MVVAGRPEATKTVLSSVFLLSSVFSFLFSLYVVVVYPDISIPIHILFITPSA
jgi:hypothetical protein